MTDEPLDPLIHAPARLQIMATLAALPDGDALTFTRLQDLLQLTPGNLITHLRRLESADYLRSDRSGSGSTARTAIRLTPLGRLALDRYAAAIRRLLPRP